VLPISEKYYHICINFVNIPLGSEKKIGPCYKTKEPKGRCSDSSTRSHMLTRQADARRQLWLKSNPDVIIQQKCPGESSRAVGFTERQRLSCLTGKQGRNLYRISDMICIKVSVICNGSIWGKHYRLSRRKRQHGYWENRVMDIALSVHSGRCSLRTPMAFWPIAEGSAVIGPPQPATNGRVVRSGEVLGGEPAGQPRHFRLGRGSAPWRCGYLDPARRAACRSQGSQDQQHHRPRCPSVPIKLRMFGDVQPQSHYQQESGRQAGDLVHQQAPNDQLRRVNADFDQHANHQAGPRHGHNQRLGDIPRIDLKPPAKQRQDKWQVEDSEQP